MHTSWQSFIDADHELAGLVQARFAANLHHVIGTLTADGAPRLSGLEAPIRDGELWLGMMPGSVKVADLRRDPRFALHSAPLEEDMAAGDAKVSARAVPADERAQEFLDGSRFEGEAVPGSMALFVADLERVTLTRVEGDTLAVTTWTPEGGTVTRSAS